MTFPKQLLLSIRCLTLIEMDVEKHGRSDSIKCLLADGGGGGGGRGGGEGWRRGGVGDGGCGRGG